MAAEPPRGEGARARASTCTGILVDIEVRGGAGGNFISRYRLHLIPGILGRLLYYVRPVPMPVPTLRRDSVMIGRRT